jgi:hypothetical protein
MEYTKRTSNRKKEKKVQLSSDGYPFEGLLSRVGAEVSSVGKQVQLSSDGYPFRVSSEKGGVVSSYAKVVRGTVDSSGKFSATTSRWRRCMRWICCRCHCLEMKSI